MTIQELLAPIKARLIRSNSFEPWENYFASGAVQFISDAPSDIRKLIEVVEVMGECLKDISDHDSEWQHCNEFVSAALEKAKQILTKENI